MSNPVFNLETFEDSDIDSRNDLYKLDFGTQIQQVTERAATQSVVGALTGLVEETTAAPSRVLTASEANEKYGTKSLKFTDPVKESIAQQRLDRNTADQIRNKVIDTANADNNFWSNSANFIAEVGTSVALDPSTYLGNAVLGGLSSLTKVARNTKLVAKSAGFVDDALLATDNIFQGTKLIADSKIATGVVRGFAASTPDILSELIVQDNARRNGYDYNQALGAGAIGLTLGLNVFFQVRGIDEALKMTNRTLKNTSNVPDPEDLVNSGMLNKESVQNINIKVARDLENGLLDEIEISDMYKLDMASNVYKSVERAVTKGLLNGIAKAEDLLKIDPSDMYKLKPALTLKGLVKRESGLLRDVADDVIPAEVKNIKEATTKIDELTTALETADELSAPAIKAELDTYIAARNLRLSNDIDAVFEGIDYSNLTFDEFLDEYKLLTSNIKGKRISSLDKFFNKDIATRQTIAKLLKLINPLDEEVDFNALLNMADDDLKAAFTVNSTAIDAFSEASSNVKARFLDRMQNKETYLDIEARKNATNTDNFIKDSADKQAYETLLKRVESEFGELPEDLKLQFDMIDKETGILKGWEQASQCLLRGLIDG